jgi:cellobiose epimerase
MKHHISFFLLITAICTSCSRNATDPREVKDDFNRDELASVLETSLRKESLDKWYPLSFDTTSGGFLSSWTYDWKPEGDQRKMIVTQARHTWVNSRASLMYPDQNHFRKGALLGFNFLKDKMWDKTNGGFFTLVSREGKPLDDTKNAYGNAFGIYALAGYYAATKDTSALNLAKKTFLWLEEKSHDKVNNGYYQHLTREGAIIKRDPSIDSKAETGYKDQNSSIHLLEAFAELYTVWPDPLLKERLHEMLVLVRDRLTKEKGYLVLFFTPEWQPVSFRDSTREVIEEHHSLDHVSFGHDIETAYLLLEASHVLGIKNDSITLKKAKRMVDHCLTYGYDPQTGGIYDEGYYFKGDEQLTITKDTKNWWAQAEAMNTLLIMADLFPDDSLQYKAKFIQQWNYIDHYLIDHEYGDWYAGGLDKQPELKEGLKGHIWKATYHHFRSMANCISRLRNGEAKH